MKIAVIGGGVAGIVSAWLLAKKHEVVIYEAADYLGGHTNTVTIPNGADQGTRVDTGFIVLNNKTYPLLHRFLEEIGVAVRFADMSFAYHDSLSGFGYAGTDLNGLFCCRKNLLTPSFYHFLFQIKSFSSRAQKLLLQGWLEGRTVRELIKETKASAELVERYLVPMAGAIWSSSSQGILDFPAQTLVSFFKNHGLLSLSDRPRWQTVVGGSQSYVERFKELFKGTVRLNSAVESITRSADSVQITTREGGSENFDKVIIALHADLCLKVLKQPTSLEEQLFSSWSYSRNHTVLHTDTSLLAPKRRGWASWNYLNYGQEPSDSAVAVSYHMNRLQGLKTADDYVVTLNPRREIDPKKIICSFEYDHPNYTLSSLKTQAKLQSLQGELNSYFCGSYFGYGFHEDAVKSAVEVGKLFGVELQ